MSSERAVLQPLRVGGTTALRNRLYRAPVLEGAGDGDDVADNYAKHFVANAESGVGLVIQGSSCIYDEGRTSPGMTIVSTRERMLRMAPMVDAVHQAGASIWIQVGHGGLFSMEAWHEPYASTAGPLLVASKPPLALRPMFARRRLHVMSADEVRQLAVDYGNAAMWAREAGYDGMQLGSSNAKLLDQFLSPFWNRRDDEFGGSLEQRASVLRLIREACAERAGADFTVTVKVPIGEKAPPFTAHTTWDEGLRLAKLVEELGYDSVTPVEVSVFPDTTLSRGGTPNSLWKNKAMQTRFRAAAPKRLERAVVTGGYVIGGVTAPFKPVWNRSRFIATKAAVSIPVLAVGGIRDTHEVDEILENGQADLVGIGRPFYAEPDLPERILGGRPEPGLCQYSNLCVPAQMLGMKGNCYNPDVIKQRRQQSA
ncbi:MAG: NADH:flavin oxidoreductase [Actinomycetota bacterium]|nr:NADH:flavin oxidoreductase [Actinomycetota bacterium]